MRALAGEVAEEAWTLVVDDLSRPAFMQPALPKADHDRLKPSAETPDALDLLPTAKNHDLKQSRAALNRPDDWVYALVSLQTMSGYFGRGNPGIARMNSGFGNRPVVEVIHSDRPGARWRDALARLLPHRREVLAGPWGYRPDGLALLWALEWDGRQSLTPDRLDPNHVEICRRVRLIDDGGRLSFRSVPSDGMRIEAKALNGLVGDAWLPVDLGAEGKGGKPAESKVLTVPAKGLTADLLRRLLFQDRIALTPLQRPLPGRSGDLWLSVSVLVRGQGTTEGFHERRIPIPARVRSSVFGAAAATDPLAGLARSAVEVAGTVQNRVLKPAVFSFLEGAPDSINFDRDSAQAWWERFTGDFTTRWSDAYFPWLWSTPDGCDQDERLDDWTLRLRDHALAVLHEAVRSLPDHSGRRWRIRTLSERVFHGAFHKQFSRLNIQEDRNARTAAT